MSIKAVLDKNNAVINRIVADDDFVLPGFTLVPGEDANIGDTHDGEKFVAPAKPPSQPLSAEKIAARDAIED